MKPVKKQPWFKVFRTAIITSLVWTGTVSLMFWMFSAPDISYISIFSTMLSYGVLLFGSASILIELLTPFFVPGEAHSRSYQNPRS